MTTKLFESGALPAAFCAGSVFVEVFVRPESPSTKILLTSLGFYIG